MYYGGVNRDVYFYDYYSGIRPKGKPIDCAQKCYECETCNQSTFSQKMCKKDCNDCSACLAAVSPYASAEAILSRNYSPMTECVATCGVQNCYAYHQQMKKYRECLKTQCEADCKKQYGCRVYNDMRFRYSAPIDPRNTGCTRCWEAGFTLL